MGEVRVGGGGINWEVGVHSRTEHMYVCYISTTNYAVLGSTLDNSPPLLLSRPSLRHDSVSVATGWRHSEAGCLHQTVELFWASGVLGLWCQQLGSIEGCHSV